MDQLRLGINANDELQPNLRYNDCETASLLVPTYGQVENNQVENKNKSILWKPSYQGIVRDDHFFVDSSSGLRGQAQSQYLAEDSRRNAGTETMLI